PLRRKFLCPCVIRLGGSTIEAALGESLHGVELQLTSRLLKYLDPTIIQLVRV
ncbi:hypothetical protein NDU88_008650, partial [Pleurodeles waltl]